MELVNKENYNFEDLTEIMRILRSENGCPWDKEQTHQSIRNNFIEEAYEAAEAIDDGDRALLKEELGDVLLQVVFHAQISAEAGGFDIGGVCDGICKKLITRHPHIFAGAKADTAAQVLSNWENIKISGKGYAGIGEYIESVAKSLPALMRAEKIQKRLVKREAAAQPDIKEAIGGLLYAAVALANACETDPEQALYEYNKKIIENFSKNT